MARGKKDTSGSKQERPSTRALPGLLRRQFGGEWYYDAAFDDEPAAFISCENGRVVILDLFGTLYWEDTREKAVIDGYEQKTKAARRDVVKAA